MLSCVDVEVKLKFLRWQILHKGCQENQNFSQPLPWFSHHICSRILFLLKMKLMIVALLVCGMTFALRNTWSRHFEPVFSNCFHRSICYIDRKFEMSLHLNAYGTWQTLFGLNWRTLSATFPFEKLLWNVFRLCGFF